MKQYFSNISIRAQFLVVFLPVVALLITVNSCYNYVNETNKLMARELQKKENIKDGVKQFVNNYDLSLKLIESSLEVRIKELFDSVLINHKVDLEHQDLDTLQILLGMNPETEDLYIINRQGIIINTSKKSDLGLDFTKFGPSYVEFLDNCWENKTLFIERVATESSSRLPKKFAYQAYNDLYILELGIRYKNIDSMVNNFKSKIISFTNRYSNIQSIDLFGATEVLMSKTFGNEIDSTIKADAIQCYKTKRDTTLITFNEHETYTDLMSIDMRGAEYFEGYVLQIISDDSLQKELIYQNRNKYLITLFVSLIIVFLLVWFLAKRITKPIHMLSEKVKTMAQNSELNEVNIYGNKETTSFTNRFNQLTKNINELQSGLEQKIKDRTIELTIKNEELNKLLTERNFLIKEIHHRTKNNLQIISSLLNLQSRVVKSNVAKEAFKNSIGRVQSMGLLHEKLYKNSNFISVNSHKYLFDLVKLFDNEPNIKINLKKSNIELKSSQAISIGLILNEFIINSYKHAFKTISNGEIKIELTQKNEMISLSLKNNGDRLPDNFETKNLESLGMTVIDAFTEKLNGVFTFTNQKLEGVVLKINFPKNLNHEEE